MMEDQDNHSHTQRAGPGPRGPAAEAAVWLTLLHGEGRTPELEREFSAWLAASAANRHAFERATTIWEDVRSVTGASVLARDYSTNLGEAHVRAPVPRPGSHGSGGSTTRRTPRANLGRGPWRAFSPQLMALCSLLVAVAAVFGSWRALQRPADLVTARGEQRTVVFDDGTRVMLNTQTKVSPLQHRDGKRLVELAEGEAYFEVAKDPAHPFIVTVAGKQVVALGTAFVVKALAGDVTVILLEGKVLVDEAGAHLSPAGLAAGQGSSSGTVLTSGQSLRLRANARAGGGAQGAPAVSQQAAAFNAAAVIATPAALSPGQLSQAASWRRGEMIFDETPLADALAEVNRYGSISVELNVSRLPPPGLKVSGVFRIGDSEAFARAVAAVHGLRLEMTDKRMRLAGASAAN